MTQPANPSTWLDAFFYKDVQQAGAQLPSRPAVNFLGNVSIADNPANGSTDITVGSSGGQYTTSLNNGLNSNVQTNGLPSLRVGGPTGNFYVGGFLLPGGAAPGPGQRLTVVNTTTVPMTIVHEDTSSTAANRIDTQSGLPVTLPVGRKGTAVFEYDGTSSRWVLQNIGLAYAIFVNVRDFGAVGDGVHDDTAAIQNAINYAGPIGATVFFPQTNPNSTPKAITGATNAGPVVIHAVAHGLTNGQLAWVTGVLGNTAANGYWVCTVIDADHVSLNGSVGNGSYVSGGSIQWDPMFKLTAPLVVTPNLRLLGVGSTYLSGYALSPTSIYDARVGATTPLIHFTPDGGSPVEPTSRGVYIKGIAFICPDTTKTAYTFLIDGSTGITFEDVHIQGAEIPGGSDPGLTRLLAFEGVSYDRSTFQWGTLHFSFLGSGAGGPFKLTRCWFYDVTQGWLSSDSNGDHDYQLDGCAFDPLYTATRPAVGVNLKVNGLSIRNTSFYGDLGHTPTGPYIQLAGVGELRGCAIHTNSTGVQIQGGSFDVSHNALFCYTGVYVVGGGTVLTGKGNTYTPAQVADASGNLYPFEKKRAVIVNEPAVSTCVIDLGPDFIVSSGGYFFAESYRIGGSPAIGVVVGTAAGAGGAVVLQFQQPHGLTTGATIDTAGVGGTTEANGLGQTVTVVDTTHLLVQGTTYVHAWTSGGRCQFHTFASYQQYTAGRIHYSKLYDASTNGPVLGGLVVLEQHDAGQALNMATASVLTAAQQEPNVVTNENFNGLVTRQLPPIVPGMAFWLKKTFDNAAPTTAAGLVLKADPTDIALGFGQIMVPGMKAGAPSVGEYSSGTFNARIRVKAVYWYNAATQQDSKRWEIVDLQGDWVSTDWTPQQLTGSTCLLWLDSTLGVTVTSGAVQTWVDQISGYTVAQATAGQRPTYNAADAGYNGQPTFSFASASSQQLTGTVSLAMSQPITWYVVGENTTNIGGFFTTGAGDMTVVNDGGGSGGTVGLNAGTATVAGETTGLDSAHVICAVFNGVKSQAFIDTPCRETFELCNQNPGANGAGILSVGSDGSAANHMTGKVAAVLAFAGAHNEAQRRQVMLWLGARFGKTIVTGNP